MFPDYYKEIRLSKTTPLTVPEVIYLLDQIEDELSKDKITEQFAPFLKFVSKQLREMRRLALEVAEEAEQMGPSNIKNILPN